jgi:predicted transcriptional regulator of viral defense system
MLYVTFCYHDCKEDPMTGQLELINTLVAEGREGFTFSEAAALLDTSASATANVLRRLRDAGVVDRLNRDHYVIRPFGSLGTSAITDDLSLVVATAFKGRTHRIAYLSALSELGLLTHPVRTVFVACTQQVRFFAVSKKPLRVVIERPSTIHLEAEQVGKSLRSTLERALFESALRVDLTGSVERLAEAVAAGSGSADPTRITTLADSFGPRGSAALRRLASLVDNLNLPLTLSPEVDRRRPIVPMDRRENRVEWVDEKFRVAWNVSVEELSAVAGR